MKRTLLLASVLSISMQSAAARISVPDDVDSIAEAISRAKDGDTIFVAPGTYRESLELGSRSLTLEATDVILDASGEKAGIIIDGEGRPTILGITITGANDGIRARSLFTARGITISDTGDGIDFEDGSGGLIADSLFENNSDDGIDLDKGVDVVIERTIVRRNGDDGIEIRLHDSDIDEPVSIVIRTSLIEDNERDGIQLIDYDRLTPRELFVQDTIIRRNGGAGVGAVGGGSSRQTFTGTDLDEPVLLSGNLIADNRAGVVGGDNLTIVGNMFDGNGAHLIRVAGRSWVDGNVYRGSAADRPRTLDAAAILVGAGSRIDPPASTGDFVRSAITDPDGSPTFPTASGQEGLSKVPAPVEQPPTGIPPVEIPSMEQPPVTKPDVTDGNPSDEGTTVTTRIASSLDDVEEESNGEIRASSSDLEMVVDRTKQTVGLRFAGLDIPQGARVRSAHLQFEADSDDDGAARLFISGQAAIDPAAFTLADRDVSSRPRTSAIVEWVPAPWRKGDSKDAQRTPDLSAVLDEIVGQAGWQAGNSVVLFVQGEGRRTAESFDAEPRSAARLTVSHDGGEDRLVKGPAPIDEVADPVGVAPQVLVLAPGAQSLSIEIDSLIEFKARTVDSNGTDISAAQVWRSSRDGEIGAGSGFATRTLSVGDHVIEVVAADANGVVGRESVSISVGRDDMPPPEDIIAEEAADPVDPGASETDRVERELAAVALPDRRFVDGRSGRDGAAGSRDEPWRTLAHAFDRIEAGQTLFIREGTYDERRLELAVQGSMNRWTTVRAFPFERVVIDVSEPRLRGGDAWELVDASKRLYRSVDADFGEGVYVGKMHLKTGERHLLVPYWNDEGRAYGLRDLRSSTVTTSRGPRYVGPGVYNDSGRLYVRLDPVPASALHGRQVTAGVPETPDEVSLRLSTASSVIEVTGSYIDFADLVIAGGRSGIEMEEGSSHVRMNGMTFDVAGGAVRMRDRVNHIELRDSVIEGGFPPWVAWTDMKGGDGQSRPASHSSFKSSGGGGDFVSHVTVVGNTFNRVFDGMVMQGEHITFSDNSGFFVDDMLQLGSNSSHVEIARNRVTGAGPSHNGKGDSAEPGTTWIHHNVIDASVEVLWGKKDPDRLLRDGRRGWRAHRPFPDHSSRYLNKGDPWKIYANTVVFDGRASNDGAGAQLWDNRNKTGAAHEVYNNIFVEIGGGRFVRGLDVGGGPQRFDGNVYWRAGPSGDVVFDDMKADRGGEQDFESLDALRSSRVFTDSRRWYSPGWEANGTDADPELDARWRPSASGSAASGAVPLPEAFPGERHEYRGALKPE